MTINAAKPKQSNLVSASVPFNVSHLDITDDMALLLSECMENLQKVFNLWNAELANNAININVNKLKNNNYNI